MTTRLLTGLAAVTLGALLSAPAMAGGVSWSVGINAPIGPGVSLGTVISGGRAPMWVAPAPVVYAPEPVYYPAPVYSPPPVVYSPPPVVYSPPPVVYAPAPVYYPAPVYRAVPRRVVYAPVPVYGYGRPGHPHWHRDRDHDGYRDAPRRAPYGPVAYNDRPGR
jgi:hypothetical protein